MGCATPQSLNAASNAPNRRIRNPAVNGAVYARLIVVHAGHSDAERHRDKRLSCPRTRRARRHWASSFETFPVSPRFLESYTPAPTMAHGAIVYQLDASFVQSCNQLHEGVDVASDRIFARLHSLDRRKRQSRKLGEEALV